MERCLDICDRILKTNRCCCGCTTLRTGVIIWVSIQLIIYLLMILEAASGFEGVLGGSGALYGCMYSNKSFLFLCFFHLNLNGIWLNIQGRFTTKRRLKFQNYWRGTGMCWTGMIVLQINLIVRRLKLHTTISVISMGFVYITA